MDVSDWTHADAGMRAAGRAPLVALAGSAMTPLEAIEEAASANPDQIALVAYRKLENPPAEYRYDAVLRQIYAYANMFRRLGIARQDCVAFLLPNLPETHFAIWGGGAAGIVCPINPFLEAAQIADILQASGAKLLVTCSPQVDEEIWSKVVQLSTDGRPAVAVLFIGEIAASDRRPPNCQPIADLLRGTRNEALDFADRPSFDEVAAYFHTGGTTGVPKLAEHTHYNQLSNALIAAQSTSIADSDVSLVGLPLFHVNAVYVSGLAPLISGATVLLAGPRGFRDPQLIERFWGLVARHRVSMFNAVPTVFTMLLDRSGAPSGDISALRYAGSGGAPMPPAVFQQFQNRYRVPILEGYGLTEATCIVSCNPLDGQRKVGSIGLPVPCHDVRVGTVIDDRISDAQSGQVGELFVKGPCIFRGYKNRGSILVENDWLPTGDLARVDQDGYLWLAGRTKDIIIRGGHNIDPLVVEDVLHRHPAVELAAVVGKPDPHAGERPTAFVKLKPGCNGSADEICAFVARNLGERAAIPDRVTIIDAMPVTAVGKIFKPPLRCMAAQAALNDALVQLGLARSSFAVEIVEEEHGHSAIIHLRSSDRHEDVANMIGKHAIEVNICAGPKNGD